MDTAAIATALVAARTAQMQLAVAARLARQTASMEAATVLKLVEAAQQNAAALTASLQPGVGGQLDITA